MPERRIPPRVPEVEHPAFDNLYLETLNEIIPDIELHAENDAREALGDINQVEEGITILNIGCGIGTIAHAMAVLAPKAKIIAVDANEQLINEAKKRYQASNLRFNVEDIYELSRYHANQAKIITGERCLHHANDLDKAMQEVYASLIPGGICTFIDVNRLATTRDNLQIRLPSGEFAGLYDGLARLRDNFPDPDEYAKIILEHDFAISEDKGISRDIIFRGMSTLAAYTPQEIIESMARAGFESARQGIANMESLDLIVQAKKKEYQPKPCLRL